MSDFIEQRNLDVNIAIMFMTAELLRLNAQKVEDDKRIQGILLEILNEIKEMKNVK